VARCPRKVFSYNQLRDAVEIENADACNLCGECNRYLNQDLDLPNNSEYKALGEQDWERMIRIDEREDKYIYTVESTGALTPEDIVLKAFLFLKKKL